jgi:hypothetical protein
MTRAAKPIDLAIFIELYPECPNRLAALLQSAFIKVSYLTSLIGVGFV